MKQITGNVKSNEFISTYFWIGIIFFSSCISSTHKNVPSQITEKTENVEKQILPTKFIENLVFLEAKTISGETVTLFTDTGGGLYISDDLVKRFTLPIQSIQADNGNEIAAAKLPEFSSETTLPSLKVFDGYFPIFPKEKMQHQEADGLLGQAWFKDRIWVFDYFKQELLILSQSKPLNPNSQGHQISLGFPSNSNGARSTNYPRIPITVEGETIEMLFDTGAGIHLSDSALAKINDGKSKKRATSFIIKSIFEKWQTKHPEWRVIENADEQVNGEPMIEVPSIEVAGYTVGPVWFTRRDDGNFHDFMSQYTDKQIDGALGGSALQYFRITIDYPNATALFEK